MTMTRKQFLVTIGKGTALGALAVAASACGGDDTSNGNPVDARALDCLQNGTGVNIVGNHGHVLSVPVADIQAGTNMTYDITGSSTHSHSVTITAAMFSMLANNQSVSATSTSTTHSHQVQISCL